MAGTILYSVADGIATVTLNRPDAHNAIDEPTGKALIYAMLRAAEDAAVRVVVLASSGPSFSAGGDFNWVLEWPKLPRAEIAAAARLMADVVQSIYDVPKPTIAKVQGAAAGGGVGIVLACDYAVAGDNVKLGLTSVRNGLLAGIAIPVMIQAIGARKTRQLLMHGGMLRAQEALAIGLLDRVVPAASLDTEVATLAGELKLGAPSVQALIKRLVTEMDAAPNDGVMADAIGRHVAEQCLTPDAHEGMSAFLQKRRPKWINRAE